MFSVCFIPAIGLTKGGNMKPLTSALLFVAALSNVSAKADECDPTKILKADSYIKVLTDKTRSDASSSKAESKKDSGEFKGNYLDIMSSDGTASFERAFKETFKLSTSRDYALTESYLALSDNARDAYTKCLESKTQHLFVYPSEKVMDQEDTFVTVRMEDFLDPTLALDANVSVDGASLAAGQVGTLKMFPGGRADIRVTRSLDKPFTVHVQAGKETQSISVPARETTKLVRELRYSPNKPFGHPVNGFQDTKQMCVELKADDDAVLIPGSSQMVTPIRNISRGGQFSDTALDEKNYSPKKVCRQGSAYDDGTKGVNIGVCAYAVAEVIVRIDRTASQSKYADPKSYGANPGDPNCK